LEQNTLRRFLLQISLCVAALALAPSAFASGGHYVFDGGSQAEQGQVTAALNASAFPWDVVPGPVVVHIGRGVSSHAAPNQIWLDADLLDSGRFAWGVVQHEYAHVLDFAVLTDATRSQLHTLLGGTAWWGAEGHSSLDCERFADLVSWAFWPSQDNVLKPANAQDEGGQVTPAAFRAALAALIPGVPAVAVANVPVARATASVRPTPRRKH
jgi:hypothetical protein